MIHTHFSSLLPSFDIFTKMFLSVDNYYLVFIWENMKPGISYLTILLPVLPYRFEHTIIKSFNYLQPYTDTVVKLA